MITKFIAGSRSLTEIQQAIRFEELSFREATGSAIGTNQGTSGNLIAFKPAPKLPAQLTLAIASSQGPEGHTAAWSANMLVSGAVRHLTAWRAAAAQAAAPPAMKTTATAASKAPKAAKGAGTDTAAAPPVQLLDLAPAAAAAGSTLADENRRIDDMQWKALAERLGIEEAVLRAIAAVESAGGGFLAPPDERPKVLFEGHAFSRLTNHQYDTTHPDISYPKWDSTKYAGTGTGEWVRLDEACALDRRAALQSASWGAFQIMGFNYAVCGYSDVEAFCAAQRTSATGQLEAFARFVNREPFLKALRSKDWPAFAKAYNGPAYAKNRYDEKLAAAYAKFAQKPAGAKTAAKAAGRAPSAAAASCDGRAEFAPPQGRPAPKVKAAPVRIEAANVRVDAAQRRFQTKVRPDPIDLRDWAYEPSISVVPKPVYQPAQWLIPKFQGETSACTGFSLAALIEHLHVAAKRAADPVSGYMLYSMARRYDEWNDNDDVDEGSSLRGALKGWSRHGACLESLWPGPEMPTFVNGKTKKRSESNDWWMDAVMRPIGAYYRINLDSITDIQVALNEAQVVYASAFTHAGWNNLLHEKPVPMPKSVKGLAAIESMQGAQDAGHAFILVGYDDRGFIVQNSWGRNWGNQGHAILRYEDWLRNAMDCWVVQLGVATEEHRKIAEATSLRVDAKGKVKLGRVAHNADREIAPFVINMENNGRLSQRGMFRTNLSDLELLVADHLPEACANWNLGSKDSVDIAIYAHGGMVDEEAAAATARKWIPLLYSARIFPIFAMWESGALKTLGNIVEDELRREAPSMRSGFGDVLDRIKHWRNQRIEGLVRRSGSALWAEMKENADLLSRNADSGMQQLFAVFQEKKIATRIPKVRLHLIGHSAGAIVHNWLGPRALKAGLEIASVSLLAPAVRVDEFDTGLGREIARHGIPTLIAHLTDTAELDDPSCGPYGHSLLYLVARSFEQGPETPILGMEKHLVPAVVTRDWGEYITRMQSPGGVYRPGSGAANAGQHGLVDDDPCIQQSVLRHSARQTG